MSGYFPRTDSSVQSLYINSEASSTMPQLNYTSPTPDPRASFDSTLSEPPSWSSLDLGQPVRRQDSGSSGGQTKELSASYFSVGPSPALSLQLTVQRRRAQNRASQRAFRERKEKHVKSLEEQLQALHQRYDHLLNNFAEQTEEIAKLKGKLNEVGIETEMLHALGQTNLESPQPIQAPIYTSPDPGSDAQSFLPPAQLLTPRSYLDFGSTTTTPPVSAELVGSQSMLTPTTLAQWNATVMFNPQLPLGALSGSYDNVSESSIPRHGQTERSSPGPAPHYTSSSKNHVLKDQR